MKDKNFKGYPKIEDEKFIDKLTLKYNKYKITKIEDDYDKICNEKKFKLQLPQIFLSEFINPKTPYKSLLIFHKIGSGKSCTAIRIAENFKVKYNIYIILPASLISNFKDEIKGECTGNTYLNNDEREILLKRDNLDLVKKINDKAEEKIKKYYNILSYNIFIEKLKNKNLNLNNSLLIIDEIQNLISDKGIYYNVLKNNLKNFTNLRIIFLSATPIFDKPHEIALTLNLLDIPKKLPTGDKFYYKFTKTVKHNGKTITKVKNLELFKNLIKGYVSYYRGAHPNAFPKLKIKKIFCEMSNFQYDYYKRTLRKEKKRKGYRVNDFNQKNNFYIESRIASNIVFPNNKTKEKGFESFTDNIIKKNLDKYSIKFYKIINKIITTVGKIFIYSSFKEYGGLKSFIRVLEVYGFYNYYSDKRKKNKNFVIWSGDEDLERRGEIKSIFNSYENINGKLIRIILGTPSMKEGISLNCVRQVHLIEYSWNEKRKEQILGRVCRMCSSKLLPENKRKIKCYIYISVKKNYKNSTNVTIDQYMYNLSLEKDKIVKEFEKALVEASIDRYLNEKSNIII